MPVELVVTLRDDEKTLKRDFLLYETICLTENDPCVLQCLNQSLSEFKGEPSDIKIKATMVLK